VQRMLAALLLVAGLALGGWALLDDTGDDIGTVTLVDGDEPAASESTDDNTPLVEPQAAAASTPAPPAIGRSSARISDIDVTAVPAPSRIALPSIGVDAPIIGVGVDPDGLMTVPEDVTTVGWYRFGAAPGTNAGTVVLAGHVDDSEQGRGVFFDLRAVEVGDTITTTDESGTATEWRVTGRRSYDKASLPVDVLYRRTGPPSLVLITCGGDFDRSARSYKSNIVVEAEPLP
jgi:sortase (surface protein transpeptidase)